MSRLYNRLRTWAEETRHDADNTDHLANEDSIMGVKFETCNRVSRVHADQIDKILDEYECSCQEQ